MSKLAFVERLSVDYNEHRWLVRTEGIDDPRIAWMFFDEDRQHLEQIADETRPWIGPLHPRISQIFDSLRLGEALAFVIDDDRGPPFVKAAAQLADPIERERWSVAQVIAIGDGLAAMRQRDRGFVHRRLEPAQVFVDAGGHARLRAPIAQVAQGQRTGYTGRVGRTPVGSFSSLSPEQCRGLPLTPASDVFSLAGLLFAALEGRNPFRRDDHFATLQAIVADAPPPLATCAPGLAAVIARAFEKDPAARYPDPGTFAGELRQCVPDAVDYDECISDRISAWWPTAAPATPFRALPIERCRMAWDQLYPTATDGVRYCGSCNQEVVRAESLAAVVLISGRRCVSYTGGD